MSSELGRHPEGFIMNAVSGNSYESVAVGDEARAILGNVNTGGGSVNYGGGTINYNDGGGPKSSFLWTLANSVTSVVVTYAVKRAIGSSMPADHRQAKRFDTIANKPISQRDLYIKAAGSLNDVRNKVDGWDVNGARTNRPELRRDAFLAAVLAEYVAHFRAAGLEKIPHILIVNDNIQIEKCQLVDVATPYGDVQAGPCATMFAHHKMAAWMFSANHFGFDVYVFRSGKLKHAGLNGNGGDNGGKGFGNWMWCSPLRDTPDEPVRFTRQDLGPQHRDRKFQQELVTFFAPFGDDD